MGWFLVGIGVMMMIVAVLLALAGNYLGIGRATRPLILPLLIIGIIMLLIGGVISGLSALFDFFIKYWFLVLPLVGLILFFVFFKEKKEVNFNGFNGR